MPAPGRGLPDIGMLVAISGFSSGLVVTKSAVTVLAPAEVFAGQVLVAAAILWLVVLVRRAPLSAEGQVVPILVMGTMGPGMVYVLNILGAGLTSAVNVVLIWALMPLLMQILGRLVLAEPLRAATVVGCMIALAGVTLTLWNRRDAGGDLLGDLLIFCAVGFSCGTQLLGRHINRGRTIPPAVVACWQVTAALGVAALAFPLLGVPAVWLGGGQSYVLAELVYLGTMSTVAVFMLYNFALRHLPVGRISLYMSAIPALGTVWAALYLREPVGPVEITGVAVVVTGIALPRLLAGPSRRP